MQNTSNSSGGSRVGGLGRQIIGYRMVCLKNVLIRKKTSNAGRGVKILVGYHATNEHVIACNARTHSKQHYIHTRKMSISITLL